MGKSSLFGYHLWMKKKIKLGEKGQSSVEYILLVGVMISVAVAFFGKLNDYLLDNPDSMLNSYLAGYENVFNSDGVNASYKRFDLPR